MADLASAQTERVRDMPPSETRDAELKRLERLSADIAGKRTKFEAAERRRAEWNRRVRRAPSTSPIPDPWREAAATTRTTRTSRVQQGAREAARARAASARMAAEAAEAKAAPRARGRGGSRRTRVPAPRDGRRRQRPVGRVAAEGKEEGNDRTSRATLSRVTTPYRRLPARRSRACRFPSSRRLPAAPPRGKTPFLGRRKARVPALRAVPGR